MEMLPKKGSVPRGGPREYQSFTFVLDEKLLEEATRLSGEKTYSRAVEGALEDFVRRIKAGRILPQRSGMTSSSSRARL